MQKNNVAKQRDPVERWSPDDLRGITNRIEFAKEQSVCSLMSIMEIAEILELIQGMAPDFPESQQRYFQETADELIALAISYLEKLRTGFGKEERWNFTTNT